MPATPTDGDEVPRSVPDGLDRRELFGLALVDAPSLDPVLDQVLGGPRFDHPGVDRVLVTPNVDILVHLDQAKGSIEAEVFRRAQYVLPDGMPLVLASRVMGEPLAARLTGSGLFELLWPRLAAEQRPVVALCSSSEIVDRLQAEHPTARFVVPPVIDVRDPSQVDNVVDDLLDAVTATSADLVLLGLGHPKDAVLIARFNERWSAGAGAGGGTNGTKPPLCCGLGGSFAMYAGLARRAPEWVQRAGLEWFYRFIQEPRRLFRRYFLRDPAFVGIVWREYRQRKAAARYGGTR